MEHAATLLQPLPPEERARAQFYAVLARLFAAAPDAALLSALGDAATESSEPVAQTDLTQAWQRLALASRAMDAEAAEQEYTDLFVGVGKSEVNLHASHWLTGFMMEKPLAELRGELARLGLARRGDATILEDHLSALCETMRLLIEGAPGRPPAPLDEQQRFFDERIAPWAFDCCNAITHCALANYYRRVAEFADRFLALERDSFAMA